MRMRGVEPPRPEGHRHLKPARLPIPPHPQGFPFCVLFAGWGPTNTSINGFRRLVNNFIELCPVRDFVLGPRGLRRRKVSPRESLTGFALIKQHCVPPTCASRSSTNLFGGVENNLFASFITKFTKTEVLTTQAVIPLCTILTVVWVVSESRNRNFVSDKSKVTKISGTRFGIKLSNRPK